MTRRPAWTSTNTDTNSFTAAGDCGGHQRSVLDLDLEREDGDEWGGVIVSQCVTSSTLSTVDARWANKILETSSGVCGISSWVWGT